MIDFGDPQAGEPCGSGWMGVRPGSYLSFVLGRKQNPKQKGCYDYDSCCDRDYSVIDDIGPVATAADAAKHSPPASHYLCEAKGRRFVAEVGQGVGLSTYEQPLVNRILPFDRPTVSEPGMIIAVKRREEEPG